MVAMVTTVAMVTMYPSVAPPTPQWHHVTVVVTPTIMVEISEALASF